MLLAATAARAFDFRVEVSAGQRVYFTIITGTQTVKVVNPDWDNYTAPTGHLTLPGTVENNGTTYNVTAIDERAFQSCNELTGITVPEGVTSIGRMAFAQCTALESISLPSTLNVIGSMAFTGTAYFCNDDNMTDGLLFIGNYLVASSPNITGEIVLRDGTLGIGNMAMYSCSSIARVTLPETVRFIGEQAFNGCASLDTIELLGTTPPTLENNTFTDAGEFTVLVPCNSGNIYRNTSNWEALSIVEKCNVAITATETSPAFAVSAVKGGLIIVSKEDKKFTISDLMGHRITEQRSGFVALPSHGIYFVNATGISPVKVVY